MSTTEPVNLPLTLGRQIAEARRRTGMSQEKYAETRGVHRNTVGRWERDVEIPDFSEIVILSRLSGWPIDLFARSIDLTDDGPETPGGLPNQPLACNADTRAKVIAWPFPAPTVKAA